MKSEHSSMVEFLASNQGISVRIRLFAQNTKSEKSDLEIIKRRIGR